MATILWVSGKTEKFEPPNDILSIAEISRIVNGLVEPLFVGEYWFFTCKNGLRLKRDFNGRASELLGVEIFGDVLIAKDNELSPTFFFPPEVIREIQAMGANLAQKMIRENPELAESKVSEEEKEVAIDKMMESGYNSLIKKGKTFAQLMKHFELYNDGIQSVNIAPVKEESLKAMDTMITYFTEKEDYEKCADLAKFREQMVEYYESF